MSCFTFFFLVLSTFVILISASSVSSNQALIVWSAWCVCRVVFSGPD